MHFIFKLSYQLLKCVDTLYVTEKGTVHKVCVKI